MYQADECDANDRNEFQESGIRFVNLRRSRPDNVLSENEAVRCSVADENEKRRKNAASKISRSRVGFLKLR